MEKKLKLYSYIDGVNDEPFPSAEEQIEIYAFEYNANRMGGAPSISAKIKHRICLDNIWHDKVYAAFNGEMFFILNTPSSSKSNTDERYEHDAQFLSEREVLNHVYFLDTVSGGEVIPPEKKESCFSTGAWDNYKPWLMESLWKMEGAKAKALPQNDKPLSNSTKVQFMGDLKEFVGRLNHSLNNSRLPYSAVIDEGIVTDNKLISFQDKYIASALQEAFTQYGVPYYFSGRTIHFGYEDNTVTTPLKYGSTEALMSVSKQNANYLVINRITGQGSSDNIPYYYPNPSDDRAAIEAAGGKWITPSQNLMPPIYRESKGTERFYNAQNGRYPTPSGDGYYEFENLYSERKQLEGKVDFPEIKPSIVGMTNASGQRIDQFIEFAYDETDDDSYNDEENEYTHSYFFAKMRKTDGKFGFNLFDQANEKQTMQVSMTEGVCGACTFEIGVGEKTQKNIVQVDDQGNLKRDEKGNVIRTGQPQDRQNDTRNNEVWIALKKDDTTYPSYKPMPNTHANLKPSANDKFVLLGITMPQAYIDAAEERLKESLIKYMYMNNREKFNLSIRFSRIYLEEHHEVLNTLNENSKILVEYNGQSHTLYVDDYSYKMDGNSPLPEIEVNLVDTLTIGKNSLQTALDSVKQDILSSIGGGDFLKQGLKYFLRKDISDTARGLIRFLGGAEFGNFSLNQSGTRIDTLGNIIAHRLMSHGYREGALGTGFVLKNDPKTGKSYMEVDELFVRVKAFFTELEIKKLSYAGGNWVFSPAGATCSKVEEFDSYYRCYFENSNKEETVENEFRVDDQVRSQEFNVKVGTSQNVSSRYYWRRCIAVGDNYIDLSKTDYDTSVPNDAPKVGDAMVTLGNWTDESRQNALVISAYGDGSPSFTQHSGIGKIHFSLKDTEKTRISPQENKFTGKFVFATSNKDVEQELNNSNLKVDEAVKELAENIKFTNQIKKDLDEVKKQSDGAIETWFYDPVPTLDNEPAKNWTTDEEKNKHLADMYYDGNGKAYRFQLKDSVYSWQIIADSDVQKALEAAKKAQDTADNKRKVFVSTPTNKSTYDEGDLWVNATYPEVGEPKKYINELLRCIHAKGENDNFWSIDDWAKASKYTDDTKANQAIEDAANAKIEAENASASAQDAKDKLTQWADDKVISPTEKQSLKDEIVRIDADRLDIENNYTKYNLGTPTAFLNAYTAYRQVLSKLSAKTPDTIAIPSDFAAKQEAYYNQRTIALKAIADAALKYVDDKSKADREYVDTTFSAVDGKIEASVKKYVGGANLLKNTALDVDKKPFYEGDDTVATIDNSSRYNGRNSMKTVFGGGGDNRFVAWESYGYHNPNKTYTCTFYAMTNSQSLVLKTKLLFNTEVKEVTLTRNWQKYTIQYNPKEGSWDNWVMWTNYGGTIYINSPQIEEGENATAWRPAPEDMKFYTDAKVEISEGKITSQVTKVESTLDGKIQENTSRIDQTDKNISLKVSEKVTEELGNLEIGGRNLLIGTNRGNENWWFNTNGGKATITSEINRGINSTKFNVTQMGSSWNLFVYKCNESYKMWQKGKKCVLSFDVYPSVTTTINAIIATAQSTEYIVYFGNGVDIQANKWNHVVMKASFGGEDAWYTNNKHLLMACGQTGTYIFQNLQLEEGTLATDWSPATQDIEKANENLLLNGSSEYTTVNGAYSLNSSKVYKLSRTWNSMKGKYATISFDYEYKNLKTGSGKQRFGLELGINTSSGISYGINCWVMLDSNAALADKKGRHSGLVNIPHNITDTSNSGIIAYIQCKGGSGDVTIKNIKIEEGTIATPFTLAPQDYSNDKKDLLETGIDIDAHSVTVTADNFNVRSRDNTPIAAFEYNITTGMPQLRASYINAELIDASKLNVTKINAIKGTIGTFDIDDKGLRALDSVKGAYIVIGDEEDYSISNRNFFTLNHPNSSAFMHAWSNYKDSFDVRCAANGKNAINILSTNGAFAIKSQGKIQLSNEDQNGFVKVQGLTTMGRVISTNDNIHSNDDFIEFRNSSRITVYLPSNAPNGKVLYCKKYSGTSNVILKGQFVSQGNDSRVYTDWDIPNSSFELRKDSKGAWVIFYCG